MKTQPERKKELRNLEYRVFSNHFAITSGRKDMRECSFSQRQFPLSFWSCPEDMHHAIKCSPLRGDLESFLLSLSLTLCAPKIRWNSSSDLAAASSAYSNHQGWKGVIAHTQLCSWGFYCPWLIRYGDSCIIDWAIYFGCAWIYKSLKLGTILETNSIYIVFHFHLVFVLKKVENKKCEYRDPEIIRFHKTIDFSLLIWTEKKPSIHSIMRSGLRFRLRFHHPSHQFNRKKKTMTEK